MAKRKTRKPRRPPSTKRGFVYGVIVAAVLL